MYSSLLSELEQPRLTTCSFWPYTISENAEVVILMRSKKDSKNVPYYQDFGTSIRGGDKDVNILFAAARSYINKTAGLCLASELESLSNSTEVEKRVREFTGLRTAEDMFTANKKLQEMLQTFVNNASHLVVDIIGDTHAAVYYPLPYFSLDLLNKAYAESEKYRDLSLHWVPLNLISKPEFHNHFLTAFDFQVLALAAP